MRTRGTTLLESLVATVVLTSVVGVAVDALEATRKAAQASTRAMIAPTRAAQVASLVAGELRNASQATLSVGSTTIDFKPVSGYTSTGVSVGAQLGPSVEFALDSDGVFRRRTYSSPGVVATTTEIARQLAAVQFSTLSDGRVTVFVAVPLTTGFDTAAVGSRGVVIAVKPRNP